MKAAKKGVRENEVPEVQGDKEEGRGEDGTRGEMGEERQVMLSPRHTRSERKKRRERGWKERDLAQTHVLRILRRARTHAVAARRTRRARAHTI